MVGFRGDNAWYSILSPKNLVEEIQVQVIEDPPSIGRSTTTERDAGDAGLFHGLGEYLLNKI